jgi:tRNA pseudouridine55 synthase
MGRRGATALAGILPIDKPAGMTSHDVVAQVRRATGEGRVGHAGTLDPAATGLLVVLVGPYTRLAPYLSGAVKDYDASIAFGTETDTDDAEGEIVEVAPVPDVLFESHRAQSALDAFLGEQLQTPPAYSAIKVAGRVAHRAARAGEALTLEPRPIDVHVAELLALDPGARTWTVHFRVSKGTYVRSLARDLGRACGTVAHLAGLRRTRSGQIDLAGAHPLDDVLEIAAQGRVTSLFAGPLAALGLPVVEGDAAALAVGSALPGSLAPGLPTGAALAVTLEGRLAGVYRAAADGRLLPEVVLAGGAR